MNMLGNPQSEARHKAASTHPDARDLENAARFARLLFEAKCLVFGFLRQLTSDR